MVRVTACFLMWREDAHLNILNLDVFKVVLSIISCDVRRFRALGRWRLCICDGILSALARNFIDIQLSPSTVLTLPDNILFFRSTTALDIGHRKVWNWSRMNSLHLFRHCVHPNKPVGAINLNTFGTLRRDLVLPCNEHAAMIAVFVPVHDYEKFCIAYWNDSEGYRKAFAHKHVDIK